MNEFENQPGKLEQYSSAVSLSDMEIFIFPDLLYSLVLANIMSPVIWEWRNDPWFKGLDEMPDHRKIQRLKQFIMDRYEFNLDLDTWGLTDKATEIDRFKNLIAPEELERCNALFGYEGDQYYFDIDIRRHFGLDKYTSDTIPYWKTETVEAMNAFRFKPDYRTGAGECVSLSTLYAAALFVVCKIPLEKIFLLATPLHSQNFIDVSDGILTNNRRIVTHNMWFNGTTLTAKAQRALRNEQVTIVSHLSGYIHVLYPEATIDRAALNHFAEQLEAFMTADRINLDLLANFLRAENRFQRCFMIRRKTHGRKSWLPMEKAFQYEHGSAFRISDGSREKLMQEIDGEEFYPAPLPGRICLNDLAKALGRVDVEKAERAHIGKFAREIGHEKAEEILHALLDFIRFRPRLPDAEAKNFTAGNIPDLNPEMSRDEFTGALQSARPDWPVADLAFHALRDLATVDWTPFFKAALERNPVCIEAAGGMNDNELLEYLDNLPEESIYNGTRAAQPDEVWNFGRGDGFEKAVTAAAILYRRHPDRTLKVKAQGGKVELQIGPDRHVWADPKNLDGSYETAST